MLNTCSTPKDMVLNWLSCCSGLITEKPNPMAATSTQKTSRKGRIFIRMSCVMVA